MDEHAGGVPGQALSAGVCIVGGDGLIGRALLAACRAAGVEVVATTRRAHGGPGRSMQLDLSARPSIAAFRVSSGITFICAAVTSMRACEDRPTDAREINVDAPVALARKVVASGGHVVFLSTNAVFSGSRPYPSPSDRVLPANEYGRQKAEAEARLLEIGGCTIVRLTKVLSSQLALIHDWREKLLRREAIRPFSDLSIAPVALSHVSASLLRVGGLRYEGVLHLSGERDVSYVEFAHVYARRLGASPDLVISITSKEAGVDLPPSGAFTALRMSATEARIGLRAQSAVDVAGQLLSEKTP